MTDMQTSGMTERQTSKDGMAQSEIRYRHGRTVKTGRRDRNRKTDRLTERQTQDDRQTNKLHDKNEKRSALAKIMSGPN
jgi:hypothetical protein